MRLTTTQKQSDYKVEQSSFTLIALFGSKLVVISLMEPGLMEIRPYVVEQHFGSELVDIEVKN